MCDLVCEVDIPDAECEVGHVVPHLGHGVGLLGGVQGALSIMSLCHHVMCHRVMCHRVMRCYLEAGDGHVVLLGVEAAEAQVVVQLSSRYPHLRALSHIPPWKDNC